jgi:hypothetical protein
MKHYIYVAGHDYEYKGVDFSAFAWARMARQAAKDTSTEDRDFIIFDTRSGSIDTFQHRFPGGKLRKKQIGQSVFTPLRKSHYHEWQDAGGARHYSLLNDQRGLLSITEVYAAVRRIGINHPGTLRELSFFSHAWSGGPILVNSTDDRRVTRPAVPPRTIEVPAGPDVPPIPLTLPGLPEMVVPLNGTQRDPDDFDPREIDFWPPNMSVDGKKDFRAAFHPSGFSWSWGCAFPRDVHYILRQVQRHPLYKESGLKDDVSFTFTSFGKEHADHISQILSLAIPNHNNVTLTFGQIRDYIRRQTLATWTRALAVASERIAYGGLIGTYSEYDTGKEPLMHVKASFKSHFTFYKNYLDIPLDPEGRNYGVYRPEYDWLKP